MFAEVQKMSYNCSFDSNIRLIKAVQKRPYLYDKSTFSVTQNELIIANAWSKISKEVKLSRKCFKYHFSQLSNYLIIFLSFPYRGAMCEAMEVSSSQIYSIT